jgi:outer membrane lipase/esterase
LIKRVVFGRALLPVFTVAILAFAGSPAAATTYTSMVVFGDSLSDDGNNALTIGTPSQTITGNSYVPTFPYASGVYSNGPVWATDAAQQLGLTLAPSKAGGTDYAYGGATTGPAGSPFPFSLLTQASQYLTSTGNAASSSALYVVAGGGNDARAALSAIAANPPSSAPATIAATAASFAANILTIVNELNAAGAQHIVVWDTPNLGLAPAVVAGGGGSLGTLLAETMNADLAALLAGKTDVSTFDIFGLGTSIALDPSAYGFTNVTDACGAVAGANCNTYAYWDGIHPTAAAHEVIADAFVDEVTGVPEPSTWAMMILGFAGVGFMAYRRKQSGPAFSVA